MIYQLCDLIHVGGLINYYIIGCRKFLQTSLEKKFILINNYLK